MTEPETRLLVVDDQEMNRDMLARRFRRKGFAVDTAQGGEEALARLETQAYDVVLLDIMMPGVDGLETLRRIRRTRNIAELPVIMVTAKTEKESIVEALAAGANDYVTKPVDFAVALARVETQVRIRRLQEALNREREWIHEVFGQYVAHDVRDAVLAGTASLDGEILDVTVLFADLKGFTTLTEREDPKTVVQMLNRYFAEMSRVVQAQGGLVLQFLGDEIYAVFGAPAARPDHASQGFRAALEMGRALEGLNRALEGEGHPTLRHAVGFHSGTVLAASLGSPDRQTYLLVGDTVNTAARIQALAAEQGAEVYLSGETYGRLTDDDRAGHPMDALPPVTVKGKEHPVTVYAFCGP